MLPAPLEGPVMPAQAGIQSRLEPGPRVRGGDKP